MSEVQKINETKEENEGRIHNLPALVFGGMAGVSATLGGTFLGSASSLADAAFVASTGVLTYIFSYPVRENPRYGVPGVLLGVFGTAALMSHSNDADYKDLLKEVRTRTTIEVKADLEELGR